MYQQSQFQFTNREDWLFPVMEIVDDDTDELIDLTTAIITVGIYDTRARIGGYDGYGGFNCALPIVTGSTDDGTIILPDSTSFQIRIPRANVVNYFGTFNIGVTVENAGLTASFIVGLLSVQQGFVPA
jgi:hypothetical protein